MQLPAYRGGARREKQQLSAYRKLHITEKKAILNKTKMKFGELTLKLFGTKSTVCCKVVLHWEGGWWGQVLSATQELLKVKVKAGEGH